MIFLGLPVSSFAGSNVEEEIARLKGELEAVQEAARQKGCKLPYVGDPTVPNYMPPQAPS
jgi:hypothetical protein